MVQAEKRVPASSSDISPSMSPGRASARRARPPQGYTVDSDGAVQHDQHVVALLVWPITSWSGGTCTNCR